MRRRTYKVMAGIQPERWRQSRWAGDDGGFGAIAVDANRVLWFNDIEDGFNVSRFTERGTIPEREYWCNQDQLSLALRELMIGTYTTVKSGPLVRTPGTRIFQLLKSLIPRSIRPTH